jgi:hypothetical protein
MEMGVLVKEKYGNECIMVMVLYDNMIGILHRRWSIAIGIGTIWFHGMWMDSWIDAH